MIFPLIPKSCKCKSDGCIYTVDSTVDACLLNPFKTYHLLMFGKKEIICLRSGSDLHLHGDPSGETRTCTLCYLHDTFGSLPLFIPNLHSCIPQTKYPWRKLHPLWQLWWGIFWKLHLRSGLPGCKCETGSQTVSTAFDETLFAAQ